MSRKPEIEIRILAIVLCFALFNVSDVVAQLKAVTPDGRTVLLHDDGTWQFSADAPESLLTEVNAEAPGYSYEVFDASVDKLSPGFTGHDPDDVYRALSALDLRKEESETEDEYKSRLRKITSGTLAGPLDFGSLFAFQTPLRTFNLEYDVENRSLTIVKLLWSHRTILGDVNYHGFELEEELIRERTYTGSNAYGESVEIESKAYNVIAVNISKTSVKNLQRDRHKKISWDYGRKKLEIKLPMDPSLARSLKDGSALDSDLSILLLGHFESPYAVYETSFLSPTIDLPHESLRMYKVLFLDLSDIWIYNQKTGEVYGKMRK